MNEKRIYGLIRIYNQTFEDYRRQMLWLLNKTDWPQGRRHVVLEDISKRILIELLRNHEYLKEECGLPNALT